MSIKIKGLMCCVSVAGGLFLAWPGLAQERALSRPPMADTATLFVVSYRPGRRWKPGVPMGQQGLRDHFYYWKALTERGEVEVAGAVGPDQGLVVLRAGSQLEADRMIDQDPAVKAELFVGEAKSFVPRFVGRTLIVPVKP